MAEHNGGRTSVASAANSTRPSQDEDISVDIARLIQTLNQNKSIIGRITLASCTIALATAFLIPAKYTSTASFIPPGSSNNNSATAAIVGQLSGISAGSLLGAAKSSGDLYGGILRSRSIADELIDHFDLKKIYRVRRESQAAKRLASNTTVDVDPKTSIVTISVTDRSQQLAHDLANAYLDALRETNGRLALTDSSQRRLFFGQQLAKEKDDLEDAEVELKKTEESSGLIAPTGQTQAEIQTIAETQAQIALRQVELAALRQSATDQNPDVIRLRSEIDDLQVQLSRLQTGNGQQSDAAIPTSKVPELQLEYVRKDREVKYHEALFDMLARQYESARMDEAHDAPLLQVLDSASYPDARSSPPRTMILLGGLILGALAGCAWVLARGHIHAARSLFAATDTLSPSVLSQ